jgi:metallo-beta-lactamase family protein
MGVTIKFLGAAGTVTGSKYLVQNGKHSILVDCGIFQGDRVWRERNWEAPPREALDVDAVLITHAHIDHTGMLPRFHKLGLRAPIYASKPTVDLAQLLLTDSAALQEEEASWRQQRGKSRHNPVLPLYTRADAAAVLEQFRVARMHHDVQVAPGITARWSRIGHILGACAITLTISGETITFSGDIGRYGVPIYRDPEPVELGDTLLIESTYADRLHSDTDPSEKLAAVISQTANRGGAVVIPSFAVGRAQLLLYHLGVLKRARKIPDVPVIVDSPMGRDATEIYRNSPGEYDDEARRRLEAGEGILSCSKLHFTQSRQESIQLNSIAEPMVIISASGMLSGGRVLHHLRHRISSPQNTVLFVGFQPPGGRGAWIQSGAESLRIFGEEVPIRAQIEQISGLSAHGDRDEMLRWCRSCSGTPRQVYIVHGEPESAASFQTTLQQEFGWNARPAKYLEQVTVS